MRLLVTGGAGFIGSHIAEEAARAGWEVAVLDDLATGHLDNLPRDAQFFEVDLRDAAAVKEAFAAFKPEVVSHQAAQASVAVSMREPKLDAEINLIGGLNLLEAARECGVKRIVFASTGGAIYGEVPEGQKATSAWPANPISPYAASKLAFESYLRVYAVNYGIATSVLRYANVYGPRQDPHGEAGVVAIFLERLLAGLPLQINAMNHAGDEGCIRDYVYVGDVVRANMLAHGGRFDDLILNVCTGTATSTLQLARLARELVGKGNMRFAPSRPGDAKRSVLDAAEFTLLIGPPTELRCGLEHTVAWFRSRAARYKAV